MQSIIRFVFAALMFALTVHDAVTRPPPHHPFDPCDPARVVDLTKWLDECDPPLDGIMPPLRSLSDEDAALFHPFADEPPAD